MWGEEQTSLTEVGSHGHRSGCCRETREGVAARHRSSAGRIRTRSRGVLAVADGRIEHIGFNLEVKTTPDPRTGLLVKGWGRYVIVRHDDRNTTLYAHLQRASTVHLEKGARVLTGALLGLADNTGGSTAPHLHLEYASEGRRHIDPDLCRQPEEDPPAVTASIVPFFTGGPFGGFQSKPGTGVQRTITITFSGPVSSVTITALDPDFFGNRAEARNASGALVASQGFAFDNTPGELTTSTVTLTAPGIIRVLLMKWHHIAV